MHIAQGETVVQHNFNKLIKKKSLTICDWQADQSSVFDYRVSLALESRYPVLEFIMAVKHSELLRVHLC